ncbi:MAG: HNH endonuclease [Planctomycetaceae bacterium]
MKDTAPGDEIWFYVPSPHSAIVASGVAQSHANPGEGDGDWRYRVTVGEMRWIESPVTLKELRRRFPEWRWTKRARSRLPLNEAVASFLRQRTGFVPPPSAVENNHRGYVFLWNPSKDEDSFRNYEKLRADAQAGKAYSTGWICPSTKPQKGDIAYMQRTGLVDNGIFARGEVTKGSFEDAEGRRFVRLRLDSFLPLGLEISRNMLMSRANYKAVWQPQASGATIPPELSIALKDLWELHNNPPIANDSEELPERVHSVISRIVRDTGASIALKSKYDFKCQICDETLRYGAKQWYIEVHHLRPLGHPHDGPDAESNMLVLCPNHHALFDLGVPRFVNNSTVKINGTRHKLTLKHKIAGGHIEYYMKSIARS